MRIHNNLSRAIVAVLVVILAAAAAVTQEIDAIQGAPVALKIRAVSKTDESSSRAGSEQRISVYERLLSDTPSDPLVLNNLGVLYFEAGRVDAGIDLLRKAADASPRVWNYQLHASAALAQKKLYDDAIAYAERARDADKSQFRPRQQLCSLYLAKRMLAAAVDCYRELTVDRRAEPMDELGLAEALLISNKPAEAERVVRDVIAKSPNIADAYNDLGAAMFLQKRHKEAIDAFRQAVGIEPDHAQLRFNLAVAEMAVKNRSGVISQYNMLKKSDPEMAKRLYSLMFSDQVVNAGP